ncbi:MAG: hypothetical protein QOF44_2152, partial [Streptomyces sp.]|nr:hypothetical protein [Streptomyces sp.]
MIGPYARRGTLTAFAVLVLTAAALPG